MFLNYHFQARFLILYGVMFIFIFESKNCITFLYKLMKYDDIF